MLLKNQSRLLFKEDDIITVFPQMLYKASLIFLIIPYLLFFATWIRPIIGYAAILVLLFSYFKTLKSISPQIKFQVSKKSRIRKILIIILLSLTMTGISGIGGFSVQTYDYYKHNIISQDLITKDWPVIYQNNNHDDVFLSYYLAYYLPSSLLAKICSSSGNYSIFFPIFSFLWGCFGLFLVICWLYTFSRHNLLLTFIIFFVLIGFDFLMVLFIKISSIDFNMFSKFDDFGIKICDAYTLYNPNNIYHLRWSPQHSIGGWLLTSLIYYNIRNAKIENIFFVFSLSFLWSVFIAVGLFPFVIYSTFKLFSKRMFSFQNCFGGGTFLVIFFLYYQAHLQINYMNFIITSSFTVKDILSVLYFIFYEFLLYGVFINYFRIYVPAIQENKVFLYISLAYLSLASFFVIGRYNDLMLHGSIPGTFFLSLFIIHIFLGIKYVPKSINLYLFIFVIILGSIMPIIEVSHSFQIHDMYEDKKFEPSLIFAKEHKYSIMELNEYHKIMNKELDFNSVNQYVGSKNSIFYNYILKK